MSHVVRNLPMVAWGGLIGWLLAKAHRGWVVNLQRRRIQGPSPRTPGSCGARAPASGRATPHRVARRVPQRAQRLRRKASLTFSAACLRLALV